MTLSIKFHAQEIVVNRSDDLNNQYQFKLLSTVLSRAQDKKYQIKQYDHVLNQTQMVQKLKSQELDVMWAGTKKLYEQELRAIYIPLFKGLLGYRLMIVREEDKDRYRDINNIEDLRSINMGQGRLWADAKILQSAGMNLVTTLKYENLFYMLEGGRFDAFPRGVFEPFSEIKKYKHLPLTVEPHLVIAYPLAAYYFVRKDNNELARVIEDGLLKLIESGEFDQILENDEMVGTALSKANLADRTIIRIDNPYLSDKTPFNDERLWYKF